MAEGVAVRRCRCPLPLPLRSGRAGDRAGDGDRRRSSAPVRRGVGDAAARSRWRVVVVAGWSPRRTSAPAVDAGVVLVHDHGGSGWERCCGTCRVVGFGVSLACARTGPVVPLTIDTVARRASRPAAWTLRLRAPAGAGCAVRCRRGSATGAASTGRGAVVASATTSWAPESGPSRRPGRSSRPATTTAVSAPVAACVQESLMFPPIETDNDKTRYRQHAGYLEAKWGASRSSSSSGSRCWR